MTASATSTRSVVSDASVWTITFAPAEGDGKVGIGLMQEEYYKDGTWIGARRLNGDETHQGRHVRLAHGTRTVQRVKLYRYQ